MHGRVRKSTTNPIILFRRICRKYGLVARHLDGNRFKLYDVEVKVVGYDILRYGVILELPTGRKVVMKSDLIGLYSTLEIIFKEMHFDRVMGELKKRYDIDDIVKVANDVAISFAIYNKKVAEVNIVFRGEIIDVVFAVLWGAYGIIDLSEAYIRGDASDIFELWRNVEIIG